jgi:hypothetical protein
MRAAPTTGEQPGGSDNPKADRAAAKAYAKAQRPFWKKKRVIIPAVFVGLAIFGTAVGGGGSNTTNTTAIKSEAPAATAPAQPAETSGQRNARQAAENYLSISAFSRKGLIQQLSSAAGDGYSVADATYGVGAQRADSMEQAYKAAKNHLSISSFSRTGLIEQLSSAAGDQYTLEEATFGANKALAK